MAPRPPLDRLTARPSPNTWDDDELVTLAEGAALFFPAGPFNADALRAAVQRGELAACNVCGRTFTTPRALKDLKTPKRLQA